jgi:F-type H+-transporting ATPase subunit gamma
MPSTIDIRRRIRSVKNSQQITKAMKMVAAAKLRRAQERLVAARPYAAGLRKVLSSVSTRVDISAHPLLQAREPERNVVVIVVTADRGLCGAFNANVIRAAQNFIRDRPLRWRFFQAPSHSGPAKRHGLAGALARCCA